MPTRERARVVIIGAGICGAATAYFLSCAGETDIIVLECEAAFNRHSSGRSASYFVPMYETWLLAHLARLAEPFLQSPPEGFSSYPLLDRRGAVIAANEASIATLFTETAKARAVGIPVEEIDVARISELIPIARPQAIAAALFYPGAGAIDCNALSMGYIANAKRAGVRFELDRRFTQARVRDGKVVGAETDAGPVDCEVIVNAAGAWAGQVAEMSNAFRIACQPKRRHVIAVALPAELKDARWPFFICPSIPLYFRAEAGQVLASGMDAEPIEASDCQTDEMQIAIVADALHAHTTLSFTHIQSSWAGLRVFAPDEYPLVGWDPKLQGFMWVACVGGTGIQSSPVIGRLAADLLLARNLQEPSYPQMDPARFVLPGS